MGGVEHRFLRACRRRSVDRTPVWFMRQAGRWLPEYRALRERYSRSDLCRTPELAAEVTLQPVRRLDVDAAILFSELVLPLESMGVRFDLGQADAPAAENPVRCAADVDRLRVVEPRETLAGVLDTIRLVHDALEGHRPLIGFAGAPFTLACYAVEGGRPSACTQVRSLMYGEPEAWHRLCEKLADVSAAFLRAQVEAGAEALQIFDTWVGMLGEPDYRAYVLPHTRRLFDALADLDVPTIHFGLGTGPLLEALAEAGGDVIGIDWKVPLDEAWARIGAERGLQGNLDPALLVGPLDRLLEGAGDVLDRAARRRGHIFSLGHGLLPSTTVERAQALIRYVHAYGNR
jgi:uroporphyrinogen decarboxylase